MEIIETQGAEGRVCTLGRNRFCLGNAAGFYATWESPSVIVSDGPYGVGGYPGDPDTPDGLGEWYAPHIEAWARASTPRTTLWLWNTEVGWATVHTNLLRAGWKFMSRCVWDKGIGHIAGHTNTAMLRRLPVVTEVCAHYVRAPYVDVPAGRMHPKAWLRSEWKRSGLPLAKANEACGVENAATRRYLTEDALWYRPPARMFDKLAAYANEHGKPEGRPYFSLDGVKPLTGGQWESMRARFVCPFGVTNVWRLPQLRGDERMTANGKAVHLNQKPLELIRRILEMTSDEGDVVWDPFGGLFTTAAASMELGRVCFGAEINPETFDAGLRRIKKPRGRQQSLPLGPPP